MNKLSSAGIEKLKWARENIPAAKTFAAARENTALVFACSSGFRKRSEPHLSTTPRKKISSVIGASRVEERTIARTAGVEVVTTELFDSTRAGVRVCSATRAAKLVPIPNAAPERTSFWGWLPILRVKFLFPRAYERYASFATSEHNRVWYSNETPPSSCSCTIGSEETTLGNTKPSTTHAYEKCGINSNGSNFITSSSSSIFGAGDVFVLVA